MRLSLTHGKHGKTGEKKADKTGRKEILEQHHKVIFQRYRTLHVLSYGTQLAERGFQETITVTIS